jgi:hypothetical protein
MSQDARASEAVHAEAERTSAARLAPDPFAVTGPLAPAVDGAVDLKFGTFFRRPVGPRGLEPSARLLALDGRRVRIVGYIAQQEAPTPGLLIVAPLPVPIAEVEDGMADDLPPQTVFVHADAATAPGVLPHLPGLVQFSGVLSVGPREEPDGRVSLVRLHLDPAATAALRDRAARER